MALEMLNAGFRGQGMDDPDRAEDYIIMAARHPNTIEKLAEIPAGIAFWKACSYRYDLWQAKKEFGATEAIR
jgi:hypothetical protein